MLQLRWFFWVWAGTADALAGARLRSSIPALSSFKGIAKSILKSKSVMETVEQGLHSTTSRKKSSPL
jgi:hypothetical protein